MFAIWAQSSRTLEALTVEAASMKAVAERAMKIAAMRRSRRIRPAFLMS
jgi:hypothetical protein